LPRIEGEPRRMAGLIHDLTPQRLHERELQEAYVQAEQSRRALVTLSASLEERVREKTVDLSQALAQLEEQNRALRSLDQLKTEFVALTSHELRTPLSSIRAGLELMLSDPHPVPESARTMLDLVHRETQRLGRFVESILNLSSLEAGRLPLQLAPLSIAQCVEGVRASLAASHGGSGSPALQRLRINLPSDLPEVWADDQMLGSVLFHLVDNAIKYGEQAPILVSARAENGQVDIFVADRGPGVPPDAQGRLLQMFSRLENSDAPRVAGYGLGLYVSRRFVEAMGGEIALSSAAGEGLTVRVRLPAARESE
jgi:signal transduction histidine kinase